MKLMWVQRYEFNETKSVSMCHDLCLFLSRLNMMYIIYIYNIIMLYGISLTMQILLSEAVRRNPETGGLGVDI